MPKKTLDFGEAARVLKTALGGTVTTNDVAKLVERGHLKVVPAPEGARGGRRLFADAVERLARLGLDNAEFRRRYLS